MSISLKSIRTCNVNTANAERYRSERQLYNPHTMSCPVWSGKDLTGRQVCANSFYTKEAGCNSALDRVNVENGVSRPQYSQYITLDPSGIEGNVVENYAFGNQHLADVERVTGCDSHPPGIMM